MVWLHAIFGNRAYTSMKILVSDKCTANIHVHNTAHKRFKDAHTLLNEFMLHTRMWISQTYSDLPTLFHYVTSFLKKFSLLQRIFSCSYCDVVSVIMKLKKNTENMYCTCNRMCTCTSTGLVSLLSPD